ncbi:MAG: type I DNA topoisomerase [Candidatus Gracilibacteria bacterium]
MTKNLVIVESPAKAKTIEKYLGADFTVKASVGHIRDLEKKKMGIDIENGFIPTYIVDEDKKKIVSDLKKLAKSAENIWIATDEDREGEAIGWHLCEAIGLDTKTTKRIVFHEITKKAIEHAIQNPRTIDQNLVDAQQARRILDRIVGFEVSPILWRKVPSGTTLSAGRVQSVAMRLVVDREKEIEAFIPTESWKVKVQLEKKLIAELVKVKGKTPGFKTQKQIEDFLKNFGEGIEVKLGEKEKTLIATLKQKYPFVLEEVDTNETFRLPGAPFTTSTLQQEASRKMGFSVKQTMTTAQMLYQNGHISYMRTDSVNLSAEAMADCKEYINKNYGKEYSMVEGRKYTTKMANAQEAHEAIRPTHMENDPNTIKLDGNDLRLYKLIWERTVASQMQAAKIETTTYNFCPSSPDKGGVEGGGLGIDSKWQTKGQVILFDGFMKVYTEGKDDEDEEEGEVTLPAIKKGTTLESEVFTGNQVFSRPPGRYTEATLVKKLESEGIGRPSTYAPTITTVMDRGYVEKKQKYLFPTSLARLVSEYLEKNFADMMDYKFTANVEEEFDKVSRGEIQWQKMLKSFYKDFHPQVESAGDSERVTGERILGNHPKTGEPMSVRMGRFGPFVQIGEKTEDKKPTFASIPAGMDMETITMEQALEISSLPRVLGIHEGQEVKASIGKFGPYVVREKTFVSIPKDAPYTAYTITLEEALGLIAAKQSGTSNVIMEFGDIQVLRGKFGPYMKQGKDNFPLPKKYKDDPNALDEATCNEIIMKKIGESAPVVEKPKKKVGKKK